MLALVGYMYDCMTNPCSRECEDATPSKGPFLLGPYTTGDLLHIDSIYFQRLTDATRVLLIYDWLLFVQTPHYFPTK